MLLVFDILNHVPPIFTKVKDMFFEVKCMTTNSSLALLFNTDTVFNNSNTFFKISFYRIQISYVEGKL